MVQTLLKRSKYRSRDIPAVLRLEEIMRGCISEYLGMTTGRAIPDFTIIKCEPFVLSWAKPSALNILTSVLQSTGANLGMGLVGD